MPIPAAAIGPIIQGATALVGQGANAASQGAMNRKQRKFTEKMYQRQRDDSISDWNKQNEYNHPSAQMARLREAGLNPNLVYGNGADVTAQPVRSSSPGSWNAKAPEVDMRFVGDSLMNYQNIKMQEAQIDNLRTQNSVLVQEAALKAASTANLVMSTKRGEFDYGLATELRQTSLDTAKEQLRKLSTGADIDIQRNEREALMNSSSLREAGERIATMRDQRLTSVQQRQLMDLDAELKKMDIDLKKLGVMPSDNFLLRLLGRIINGVQRSSGIGALVPRLLK